MDRQTGRQTEKRREFERERASEGGREVKEKSKREWCGESRATKLGVCHRALSTV